MSNKKRLLSLFSGCGGMDLGFEGGFTVMEESVPPEFFKEGTAERLGDQKAILKHNNIETVFANDILDIAYKAWVPFFSKRGLSDKIFHKESIVDLVKKTELGTFKFPENIDIVTGGFPCQDFSLSGKRKGFNSHRDHNGKAREESVSTENRGLLYNWMRKVIQLTDPKVFIAENVKGLVSLGDVKQIIEKDFSTVGEGYIVIPAQVLNAKEYGVPQNRERVIFIGLNKKYLKKEAVGKILNGSLLPYPKPTHGPKGSVPFTTLRHAFRGLTEPHDELTDIAQASYSKAKYYGKGRQGNVEIKLDDVGPTIRSEHHGNIEFRRLSLDNGGKYEEEFLEGMKERRLTVRECARIQTFPDEYEFVREKKWKFPLSASGAYKVIGNAVPPLLAFHIAKRLEELWDVYFKD